MSEAGTQIGDRASAGRVGRAGRSSGPRPALDEAAVRAALAEVMDPELPMVSIVDLGMVGAVEVDAARSTSSCCPTYVGCPALELIRGAVADRLAAVRPAGHGRASFETPWTSDRITPAGLAALASAGIAPPTDVGRLRAARCAPPADCRPRQPVRADPVPIPLLLPLVPPAVRSDQAGLTWRPEIRDRRHRRAPARWAPGSPRSPWRRGTGRRSTT